MLGPYFAQDQNRQQIGLRFRLQYVTDLKADFQVPAGAIASNTRSGEGVYTMTFNKKYPVFVGGEASVMTVAASYATVAGHFVSIDVADYNATTGVLTYRTGWTDGAAGAAMVPADIPNDAWVYFDLCFCDRSTMSPTGALT